MNMQLSREDYDKLVKSGNLEQYTQQQFDAFVSSNEEILQKGNGTEELDELEKSEYDNLVEEIKSFARVEVWDTAKNSNMRLEKSIMYVRPEQVKWDEETLEKSEDGELVKAKSGTYTDTPLNRKLGRVGQKYGKKKEDADKKESGGEGKSDDKSKIKVGDVILPYAHDKYGEFVVDRVFTNKDNEISYTGKFKDSGERREFILNPKDKKIT